ncbi:class I SAM-dependent methyltransferase [Streptomyces sp. NPDC053541]|uniref:class I SAM-dependent methyltransferase n=1 Tax=Streptomyces sp. NPDC053541 TaxID=3365709 RepID=UPI0037D38B6D
MDRWETGPAYERYMGRWSRLVAARFTPWLTAWLARSDGLRWLDAGCGTGALSATVAERCRPRALLGVDLSEPFVRTAREQVPDGRFAVADAAALPVPDGAYDVAVSGLTLNFLADPAAGAAELARAVRPGDGLVAAYVWDYAEHPGFLRRFWDAVATVDPAGAVAFDEGRRFPLCRPERLHSLWTEAGLTEVATAPIDVPTVFTDFEDLWNPFLAGQGPAPGYVTSLTPGERDHLRTAYAESLPLAPDGSLALTARAWAVHGRRPER